MIYDHPLSTSKVDQGDIIDDCPLAYVEKYQSVQAGEIDWAYATSRVIVLTQTCDLANQKARHVTVAVVLDAASLVQQGMPQSADVRGPIRAGRVFGWYFLPKNEALNLSEMIVDLCQIHTVRLDLLSSLCESQCRRARLTDLYRAHLGRHFADTYARIGLPEPYETE